nr:MAG TPA: DNA polymerase I [Caudoviricetes sp.]
MKPIITVDIETYSPQDISKVGLFRYAQDPEFQVLLFGYCAEDSAAPTVLDLTLEPDPRCCLYVSMPWLFDASYTKRAHNAAFEWWCLSEYMELSWEQRVLWLQQWECSMIHALYCGLPAQLGALGQVLQQPEDTLKMKEGKALITYFCKPCKPTKRNGGRTRNLPQHDPAKWHLFCRYNGMDVIAERANDRKLAPWPVPESIMQQWREDVEMNARGVAVDMALVKGALACSALITEEQTAESKTLTGLANPGSRAQLLDWLHNRGVPMQGLTKEDVGKALAGELPSDVRRVLELRQQLGKTSNTKYETIAASAGPDHRVRGTLQFYGASRTGRWAGRLLQVQNLPRTYLDHQAEWRSIVKLHDPEALALLTDNVSDTLSQLIRTALVPGEGCTFVDADFSAIEARLIAWLAGEEWVLDVFRTTGKIYEATAARIFGVPFESIVKGNPNYKYRQRGKVATLALGYQGGVGAMKRMGGDQLGLDDEGLMDIVRRWRKQNPRICKLWDAMQKAAVHTIRTGRSTVPRPGVIFRKELAPGVPFAFLTMQLPSGRKLFYADPGATPDDRITYKEWDTGSWREAETYGGKLTENLTQAVGRDCLAFALDNLRRAGYQVVFHVHDEVIIELPTTQDAETALDAVVRIMSIVPPWAEGLPLNAAGWHGDFFTKD